MAESPHDDALPEAPDEGPAEPTSSDTDGAGHALVEEVEQQAVLLGELQSRVEKLNGELEDRDREAKLRESKIHHRLEEARGRAEAAQRAIKELPNIATREEVEQQAVLLGELQSRVEKLNGELEDRDREAKLRESKIHHRREETHQRAQTAERELDEIENRAKKARSARFTSQESDGKEEFASEPLDLNQVSFEQLRALGLSVTESARLIATRDARGGFKSITEMDDLHEVPAETIARLKVHLSCGRAPAGD